MEISRERDEQTAIAMCTAIRHPLPKVMPVNPIVVASVRSFVTLSTHWAIELATELGVRCSIPISSLIRLRPGESFRAFVRL